MRSRGVPLARRIARALQNITGDEVPTGALDITLYRDDLMRHAVGPQPLVRRTEIPFSIDDRMIILVDDVLYTGRTTRAALDALIDFGRPRPFSWSRSSIAATASCRSRPTTSARTSRRRGTRACRCACTSSTASDEVVDADARSEPMDSRPNGSRSR